MFEKVKAYFHELKQLSGQDLDASARAITLKEKGHTARLIAHLAEISARKYHLVLGYKHLFEYCVKRLNLSEGSVTRRIQVARVCNRYPQLLAALGRGGLHLTGAGLIAPHLSEDNVDDLIKQAEGKSKRAIEAMLVNRAPKAVFKPAIRKLPACPPKNDAARLSQAEAALPAPRAEARPNILEQATGERYNFRFSADRAFAEKLERFAEVLGIEVPRNHMPEILEVALDLALDKRDPQRKNARRKKRRAKACPGHLKEQASASKTEKKPRNPGTEASTASPKRTTLPETMSTQPGRHIPAVIRGRVLEKADYRCEYRSSDGRRCSARAGLQIEHTRPFAVYRSHDEAYLCVLCAEHNRLAAERYFGKAFIKKKIEAGGRLRNHGVKQIRGAVNHSLASSP